MSDTPRTDALDFRAKDPSKAELAEHARTLERENAALRAEVEEYALGVSHMRDGARLQESATTAVLERAEKAEGRVAQLEQRLEINRAVLAGARNCILKYVPVSIQSDRDFTLGSIKLALDRGTE